MTDNLVVYVCSSANRAAEARAVLVAQGFQTSEITEEPFGDLTYDSETFASGTSDAAEDAWIVIGRK